MNTITASALQVAQSIFSTACLLMSALAVALAMMLSVSIAMAAEESHVTLPVTVEIIDCTTPELVERQCYTNGYCCERLDGRTSERSSDDHTSGETTQETKEKGESNDIR